MMGMFDSECKFNIESIEGVLYYIDTPIIDFCIKNWRLVYAKDLSNGELYPWEMHELGLTYGAFNLFFNGRVVREHAQDIRMYLDFLGLKFYDFNEMIKKMNGWDALGMHWIRFKDMGAKCWHDILNQKYPIY